MDSLGGRLLVVSNRLPLTLKRHGDEWTTERSSGGLATAMDPILRQTGGLWIGWSGSKEPEPPDVLSQWKDKEGSIAVPLAAALAEDFYEGYANQVLWPLFHNFPSRLIFNPKGWHAYVEANRQFCNAVVERYEPGDRIWVHDYHLMLLPHLLREALPDAAIGFFLHIPFPASDVFAILPRREELLHGVLGADLVAFQTHFHLHNFRSSLMRRLGIESRLDGVEVGGRVIRIQALPIGIAPDRFLNLLGSPDVCRNISELRRRYEGRKILLSVDRLDYTKGLPERLQTFSRLLESSSELRGRVVLIQVAVPSREGIDMYQDLRNEVNRMISEINGRFGSADWTPVVYINRNISRAELVALYQFSDVGWISPLRDGMNLVAKEYVACRPEGDGILVLSEFAGAAAEMGEALLINPYDEERTVAMLVRALDMPDRERRARMGALHQRVLRNNVFSWAERFLSELAHAAESRAAGGIEEPPALDVNAMISAYRAARKRTLIFDYDGTLVPFAPKPEMAAPTPGLIGDLEQLLSDPANLVALVSGRSPEDLELWFGNLRGLALAAEHGAIWKAPDGTEWQNARAGVTDWKTSLRPILEHFVDRTPGSFVEEKHNALVWHYRTAEPEFGEWLANELVAMLEGMLADTDLRPLHGSKIVEIKPLWANKGEVFERLLSWFPDPEFVLAIGDDRTDEDLFSRIASNGWTVHVGRGPSKASWRLQGVSAVRDILRTLSRTAGSGQEIAPGMSRGSP